MKKTVKLSYNGITLECSPEQAKQIMFANKPAGETISESPHVEGSVLRKALKNIKADTPEQFVLAALLQTPKKDGLHVVWNGLNAELKDRFNCDPTAITKAMKDAGLITGHPFKGGYKIYLA